MITLTRTYAYTYYTSIKFQIDGIRCSLFCKESCVLCTYVYKFVHIQKFSTRDLKINLFQHFYSNQNTDFNFLLGLEFNKILAQILVPPNFSRKTKKQSTLQYYCYCDKAVAGIREH